MVAANEPKHPISATVVAFTYQLVCMFELWPLLVEDKNPHIVRKSTAKKSMGIP